MLLCLRWPRLRVGGTVPPTAVIVVVAAELVGGGLVGTRQTGYGDVGAGGGLSLNGTGRVQQLLVFVVAVGVLEKVLLVRVSDFLSNFARL